MSLGHAGSELRLVLRISTQRGAERELTIRLEGQFTGAWVGELDAVLACEGPLRRIDLSGLTFTDSAGVERLRALQAEGVELIGALPYVQQLLLRGRS